MSIIQPDTIITLYHDVPITGRQNIVFKSVAEQRAYFAKQIFKTITDSTYQEKTGTISIEMSYDDMYAFNYLSWKNTAFENKTVYARVLNIEHDNNEVVQIEFAIDWWQTGMFDLTVEPTNILRQHLSAADKTKENTNIFDMSILETLTLEPLSYSEGIRRKGELGETKFFQRFIDFDETSGMFAPKICVITSQDIVENDEWGKAPNMSWRNNWNMPQTTNVKFFDVPSLLDSDSQSFSLQEYINQYTIQGMVSSILGVYLVPAFMDMTKYNQFTSFTVPLKNLKTRNGKISRFPWRYIRLQDFAGNAKEYQLEKFDLSMSSDQNDVQVRFGMYAMMNGYPQVVLVPYSYDGVESPLGQTNDMASYNFNEKMVITDFPSLPYNVDGYLTWLGGQLRGAVSEQVMANPLDYSVGYQMMRGATNTVAGSMQYMGTDKTGMPQINAGGAAIYAANQAAGLTDRAWDVGKKRALKESGEVYARGMNALQNEGVSSMFETAKPAYAADRYVSSGTGASMPAYPFNRMGFIVEIMQPHEAIIEQYDKFYDQYGYASNMIDVPLVIKYIANTGEPTFVNGVTYVQTESMNVISPLVPMSDYIQAMFDGGHRFLKGSDL